MSQESCILTTKDFTILEIMSDRFGGDPQLGPILHRKLNGAIVVFRDGIGEDVATISSRVSYRVNGGEPELRILSFGNSHSPVGLFLSISLPRGLALIGLSSGQAFTFSRPDGMEETVVLDKVMYQPEAHRRRQDSANAAPARQTRPRLRLVHGTSAAKLPERMLPQEPDDPGPPAA